MWTHVVRTHICLCPCECSQLEPLCIHRYTHKYTYFILQILLNVNPCCANSHMSVPLRVLALRTSLYTYTYTHKYTYIKNHITDTLVYQPVLCTLTLVCALASAHTENLFVYMHVLTRLHKSHHRFICIWAHVVRTHICLCPCPCSHSEPLCIHTYVTSILIFHHRYVCISTRAVQSHTCTCHCGCSHLEPLCIHILTSITIHISYHD